MALILPQREQALDAHGEAAGRRRLAAQLRDQAVVAAAGADGALRAELVGHPLEHGQVVVIESAHQARIDPVGNRRILEQLLHALEMFERFLAEIVDQLRRRLDQACSAGFLVSRMRSGLLCSRRLPSASSWS
jgi:hypothetical protein